MFEMSHTNFYFKNSPSWLVSLLNNYLGNGEKYLHSRKESVHVNFSQNNNFLEITILHNNGKIYNKVPNDISNKSAKKVFRILRFINEYHMKKIGFQFYHAACVEINGFGVIIIGDKYAGKTTLLQTLLNTGTKNVKYISNDKIAINDKGNELELVSSPIAMGIREDNNLTKNDIDIIRKKIKEGSYKENYLEKRYYDIPDIEKKFNVEYKNYTKPSIIIKPNFQPLMTNMSKRIFIEVEKIKFLETQKLEFLSEFPLNDKYKCIFKDFEIENCNISNILQLELIELTYGKESTNDVIQYIKEVTYDS